VHNFWTTDGIGPQGGLISDAQGNLYGITVAGGLYGYGTVFELSPIAGGRWRRAVLYNFQSGTDGAGPSAPLVFDNAGNLYGTTFQGGGTGN
jgi:uncharacterized repeat protein (TIGR03803 family)